MPKPIFEKRAYWESDHLILRDDNDIIIATGENLAEFNKNLFITLFKQFPNYAFLIKFDEKPDYLCIKVYEKGIKPHRNDSFLHQ